MPAATFGRVVPIGGHASDLALDEARGVLYIANYTSGRIDVMSTADNTISRSITVSPYPGGVALSPNGKYLVVTHYASSGGSTLSKPGQDALTVIDLTNNTKRTFGLSSGPVGVEFGYDGLALIMTQTEFILFDPASGNTVVLGTVENVQSQVLPVPQNNPADPDHRRLARRHRRPPPHLRYRWRDPGYRLLFHQLAFSYNAVDHQITGAVSSISSPSLGPRALASPTPMPPTTWRAGP